MSTPLERMRGDKRVRPKILGGMEIPGRSPAPIESLKVTVSEGADLPLLDDDTCPSTVACVQFNKSQFFSNIVEVTNNPSFDLMNVWKRDDKDAE
eukprot:gene17600-779_t